MAIDPNSFTTNEVTARQLAKVVDGAWEQAKNTFASKNDAALTGTPTAPTPSEGDDSTKIATTAFVKNAVEQGLSVADALIYKGTIASGSTEDYGALTPAANKGDVYKVTSAGKIDGVAVEVGDMLICNTDETAEATADNYTTIVGKWDFIQGNTDGAVIGPSSAVSGNIAVFDGSAGDLIKDGGALGSAAFKDVPTSGNASNAQVVMGNDSRLSDARTPTSHTHGHISNDGVLNDQTVLPANGDYLVMTDASMNDEVVRSSIGFDGSTATKCLTQKGTFEDFSTLAIGSTSTTAAAGNHNHDSVYFKSSGSVTLVSGSATKIGTSNGSDVNLTLPAITTGTSNGTIKVGDTDVSVRGLCSAAYVDVPVSGDASANQAVLGSDSRLAINSDVFIATYTTSASGTTLQELAAAYNAKKKIYLSVGGQYGTDTYEQLVPLSTVRVHTNTETEEQTLTGFYFNVYHDGTIHDGSVGTVDTYYRNSGGWGVTSEDVHYAEAAGRASTADNASGYIEGGAIAQNLAAKMNINANNAASGALQNLTGQLMPGSSVDVGPDTEIYGSYTSGFNSLNHVNEPYKYTLGKLWSSYISGQTEPLYARRPIVKELSSVAYYQDGAPVQFVSINANGTSNPNYEILAHRKNAPGSWGICQVPYGDANNPYCEIDFDVSLTSYKADNTTPYAPMISDKYPTPYILHFCASYINASGNTPGGNIAYNDEHIFAVATSSISFMLGDTQSFGHVRICGYLPIAPDRNYAVLIGARGGNGLIGSGCYFHVMTSSVRVIMHPHSIISE